MVEIESAGEQQYLADCLQSMYIIKVKSQKNFHYISHLRPCHTITFSQRLPTYEKYI